MGYIRHEVLILTHHNQKEIERAHEIAMRLMPKLTTPIYPGISNEYKTFTILPDGSKEGWPESDEYDLLRQALIAELKAGGEWLGEVIRVHYGEDSPKAKRIKTYNP